MIDVSSSKPLLAVAGICTTSALALALLDASVTPESAAPTMEALAKALRREHDRLFVVAPGVI